MHPTSIQTVKLLGFDTQSSRSYGRFNFLAWRFRIPQGSNTIKVESLKLDHLPLKTEYCLQNARVGGVSGWGWDVATLEKAVKTHFKKKTSLNPDL